LTIAYDGTSFAGFARQTSARTVAGELQGAILAIDPKASNVRGASRTDAGVHARGQVVAFDSTLDIPARGWVLGLGAHLPSEIAVVRAASVAPGYDPRRHALRKTYRYLVLCSQVRDPFLTHRAWRVGDRLNQHALTAELEALLGRHDFAAFRSAADDRTETVRTILRAELQTLPNDARCVEIVIEGDRFMHRMIRIIAGTVIDVARSRLASGAVRRALASGSRGDLGITAPACGLCLDHIVLDDHGEQPWPEDPGRR
jgi:tRNA pseudouridine38-40 synthase